MHKNTCEMFRYFKILCLALIVLSVFDSVSARKVSGGRHSYPKSGGLSGSGGHHYPSSGGLSGNSHGYPSSGNSHGYPASGGLSGSGSHGYPSSSGSHGYPSSGGGSHTYPTSGNSHGYPSGGLSGSGSHGYPAGKGLSGSNTGHTTNVHYHYNYNPPQRISYTPVHGGPPMSYPVYHGPPPTYVYNYKNSGSQYGTLLAGLALLNLGTLAGSVYANRHSNYKPQPGEICKLGIRKDNGDYQETKIDCQLITSFIFEEEAKAHSGAPNSTITTTTVTNVTVMNTTNLAPDAAHSPAVPEHSYPLYTMLPNGTLVPINATMMNATTVNNTANADNSSTGGNVITSSVTSVTTTNTTVTNALDVKGKPIDVTPGIISACWVAGAGVGLLPLFGWHAAVGPAPGCYFVEVMDYNYLLFLYFATIVTPSVLLAAFYAHIYRVVVKQMSAVVTVEGGHGRNTSGTMLRVLGAAQKREVKATRNLAIIVFFFIVCWIPLYTINAIKAFLPELDIPNPLTYFCIIFSHLNSAINPLLYAYHLKDFRAALKGLICNIIGRGVPLPAAYRPPMPVRRPALERCNALRERPRVYVNSPVWLRQRQAEAAVNQDANKSLEKPVTVVPDMEPFLDKTVVNSSSGRHLSEGRENNLYLIDSNQGKCQSPYKKVEEFLRRVRSVSSEHS